MLRNRTLPKTERSGDLAADRSLTCGIGVECTRGEGPGQRGDAEDPRLVTGTHAVAGGGFSGRTPDPGDRFPAERRGGEDLPDVKTLNLSACLSLLRLLEARGYEGCELCVGGGDDQAAARWGQLCK